MVSPYSSRSQPSNPTTVARIDRPDTDPSHSQSQQCARLTQRESYQPHRGRIPRENAWRKRFQSPTPSKRRATSIFPVSSKHRETIRAHRVSPALEMPAKTQPTDDRRNTTSEAQGRSTAIRRRAGMADRPGPRQRKKGAWRPRLHEKGPGPFSRGCGMIRPWNS